MNIFVARSSSINTYRMCAFKYYLEYVLCMESLSGKAALQGTIVHAVLERIAKAKLSGTTAALPDLFTCLDQEWAKHTAENPHIELLKHTKKQQKISADYLKCVKAMETAVNDRYYAPGVGEVLAVEQRFDIPMTGDCWKIQKADGLETQLVLSGTMDLIKKINHDTIEVIDWKTGKRNDFVIGGQKDFYDLMLDVQPRLYHLAATLLYPWVRNVLVTFYYLLDGGPFTLPFDTEDLVRTAEGLHKYFAKIRKDTSLRRSRGWKCKTFCHFGRNGICEKAYADLHTYGEDDVVRTYTAMKNEKQKEIMGIVAEPQ